MTKQVQIYVSCVNASFQRCVVAYSFSGLWRHGLYPNLYTWFLKTIGKYNLPTTEEKTKSNYICGVHTQVIIADCVYMTLYSWLLWTMRYNFVGFTDLASKSLNEVTTVFENTYFTFFSDFKKTWIFRFFFEMTYQTNRKKSEDVQSSIRQNTLVSDHCNSFSSSRSVVRTEPLLNV